MMKHLNTFLGTLDLSVWILFPCVSLTLYLIYTSPIHCIVYFPVFGPCPHVTASVLTGVWMSHVCSELFTACRVFQGGCLNSAADPENINAFQSQIPSWVSLERDLTEKSHKTSFKGHTEIACLSSTISSFLLPPFLISPLSWLHSYIRWRRWRHTRRKAGMGTFASHSLEGLWDYLHLDGLSVATGHYSPDGPSTVSASLWFSSPAPALGLWPHCVPSVPSRSQARVLPLWVISLLELLWSESTHQAWPQGGLLHHPATVWNQWAELAESDTE